MSEPTFRVRMTNEFPTDEPGVTVKHEAVDSAVPASMVEAYVLDAYTRWQKIEVTANPPTEASP